MLFLMFQVFAEVHLAMFTRVGFQEKEIDIPLIDANTPGKIDGFPLK